MLRKKERSSFGLVSTERDGASHWCAVKGTDVSMVIVLLSSAAAEEIGRRRDKAESGFRRLERDEDEAKCDRAISIVGSFWPVSRELLGP